MMNEDRSDRAYVDSKYSLVVAVAKRARRIIDGGGSSSQKPVSAALHEIESGEFTIVIRDEAEGTPEAGTDMASDQLAQVLSLGS